jgi:hypothetical protein
VERVVEMARKLITVRRALYGQILVLAMVWTYVVLIHADNDGLWYQGDAPRHAANGLFWKDLVAMQPSDPVQFALEYYFRYPVIHPSAHPPAFHLLEALAYSVWGPSPFVAKTIVLAFLLLGGVYLLAWLRRWVSAEAGWAAVLLLLQPGTVAWSHAILLNVPAMAMIIASLYHARRWMETPESGHVYGFAMWALLGMLTYVQTVVIWVIVAVWLSFSRHWSLFRDRRLASMAAGAVALFAAILLVVFHGAPVHLTRILPDLGELFSANHWTYYIEALTHLVSLLVLVFAAVGALAYRGRFGTEIAYAGLWFLVAYVSLSVLVARDTRYGIILLPAVVLLAARGALVAGRWLAAPHPTRVRQRRMALCILGLLVVLHVIRAPRVDVPVVEGFREVVAFLEQQPDADRVLYEGTHNGVFSFYMKAGDPTFQRGVVLANKIIYASPDWGMHVEHAARSPEEVLQLVKAGCGCQWIVIEEGDYSSEADKLTAEPAQVLWQALSGPEFLLVKWFPIESRSSIGVRVYRLMSPVAKPVELELYVPDRGGMKALKVKPLSPRMVSFRHAQRGGMIARRSCTIGLTSASG